MREQCQGIQADPPRPGEKLLVVWSAGEGVDRQHQPVDVRGRFPSEFHAGTLSPRPRRCPGDSRVGAGSADAAKTGSRLSPSVRRRSSGRSWSRTRHPIRMPADGTAHPTPLDREGGSGGQRRRPERKEKTPWPRGPEGLCRLAQESRRARTRNEAICSRVTGSLGQNRSLSGGLQPRVIPAAARALMSRSKIEPASSSKWSTSLAGRSRARTRNAAIWPRVTLSVGQNRLLSGGLQRSEEHTSELQSRE